MEFSSVIPTYVNSYFPLPLLVPEKAYFMSLPLSVVFKKNKRSGWLQRFFYAAFFANACFLSYHRFRFELVVTHNPPMSLRQEVDRRSLTERWAKMPYDRIFLMSSFRNILYRADLKALTRNRNFPATKFSRWCYTFECAHI